MRLDIGAPVVKTDVELHSTKECKGSMLCNEVGGHGP